MKHTKGPWEVWEYNEGEGDPEWAVGPKEGGIALAHIVDCDGIGIKGEKSLKQAKANARLIAAAPEMYEAMQMVLRLLEGGSLDVRKYPKMCIITLVFVLIVGVFDMASVK